MKGFSYPSIDFLAVFLLTMLSVVELLSLLLVWQIGMLSPTVLWLIGGCMGAVTLLLWRGLFPKGLRFRQLKRLAACVLCICLTVGCMAGSLFAMELGSSLDSMFEEGEVPLTAAPQKPHEEPFIVYLGGSDTRSGKLTKGRNDVNILAVVNPNTKQLLLVNTPRDYYVRNSSGGGARDKLTHCGLYGVNCSMKTLGNLYDETVEYYVQINFTGFKKLIDAMGGITVYSDYAFTAITRTYISQGENNLTGQQALDFAR